MSIYLLHSDGINEKRFLLEHTVTIGNVWLFPWFWLDYATRIYYNQAVPMLKCVDWDDKKLLLKNINSSRPSFYVFVVLSNFYLHSLVEKLQIFLTTKRILSQQLSHQFLNEKGRVNEHILIQLLGEHLCLEILQVICNNRVI